MTPNQTPRQPSQVPAAELGDAELNAQRRAIGTMLDSLVPVAASTTHPLRHEAAALCAQAVVRHAALSEEMAERAARAARGGAERAPARVERTPDGGLSIPVDALKALAGEVVLHWPDRSRPDALSPAIARVVGGVTFPVTYVECSAGCGQRLFEFAGETHGGVCGACRARELERAGE